MGEAGDAETDVAVPECCGVPDAVRGPQVLRIDDPGTAPHHPQGTVAPSPSTTVGRRAVVILVPAVLRQLPDISVHVMKTKCIWQFLAHRVGLHA